MLVHTELFITLVYIWSQRGNTHLFALVHQLRDFRNLVTTPAHDSGHELSGIVGFQIGRLVGHPGITGSMRLIEGVRSKLLPVGPDFL